MIATPVEDDGFYTNIPPIMADKTFHMTPDRKSLVRCPTSIK